MADDFAALRAHQQEEKSRKIQRFNQKVLPQIKGFVKKYSDTLVFLEHANGHYQVKNLDTGDLVNIWHTRAMQKKGGQVMGLGYKEENLWRAVEDILHER